MVWLKAVLLCFLFFLPLLSLYADAYLAEDNIYYGADTYTLDYDRKVIRAEGNAFFERGQVMVSARKIVIHYAKEVKKAYFYRNVVIRSEANKSEVRGDYGEAHFRDDYYRIEGNVLYRDEKRRIRSKKIESEGMKRFIFSDDVEYSDGDVTVRSKFLEVDENDTALFREGVATTFIQTGDELYSESIRHFSRSGYTEFQGDVLFMQDRESGGDEGSLIARAEAVRHFRDGGYFLLLNDVYIMNSRYAFSGSVVRYYREKGMLESQGGTVVYDGRKTIYCDGMKVDLDSGEVSFFDSVRGVISVPRE